MKKRILILALAFAVVFSAAGCGKKEDKGLEEVPVTSAPSADADADSLVEMQKTEEDSIKNVIGNKTDDALKVILINGTGAAVKGIYVRPTTDDDNDWGTELVQGLFTLRDGDKALYYYDGDAKDSEGKKVTSFDIRITYEDEDFTDCYFRKLPLQSITKITLRMDGNAEDGIPYATYVTGNSTNEVSTLSEVRKRLGLDGSSDTQEPEESGDDSSSVAAEEVTPTPQQSEEEPQPTETPSEEEPQPTQEPEAPGTTGGSADEAKEFIGQPLENLIAAIGDSMGSEYENEPETGKTGYHYYDTFTVSTTVDEDGNEVVAGVW